MGRISKARTMLLMPVAVAFAVACSDQPVENAGPELGAVAQMDVVAGDAQSAEAGSQLSNPLVVRVSDALGRPVSNQIVNFRVTAGGGSVFAGAAITDAQGRAQEWWTLGEAEGENTVEARAVHTASGEKVVFARFTAKGVKKSSEKPSEEKPSEEKPAEEKPAEEKPAEEKPAEEKPAEEKPADEKAANDKPVTETSSTAWTQGVWEVTGGGVSIMLDLDRRTVTLPQIGTINVTRTVSGNRLNVSFPLPGQGNASMAFQHQSDQLRGTARMGNRSEAVVGRRPSTAAPAPQQPQPSQPAPQQPAPSQPAPPQPAPQPPTSSGQAFFADDFDNGRKNNANGFRWQSSNVVVSTDIAHSGRSALKFSFGPTEPNGNSHWWSEQRFSMGRDLREMWVEYYIYYPDGTEGIGARYQHRNSSPANNKFFRVWGGGHSNADYGSHSKVGFSTLPGDRIIAEYTRESWDNGTGRGNSTPGTEWAGSSDLGRWVQVRMHLRHVSRQGASDGIMRLWKDGKLVINFTGMDQKWGAADRSDPGHTSWNAGYLMGYDNSGFDRNTHVYIDDVKFFDSNPGWR